MLTRGAQRTTPRMRLFAGWRDVFSIGIGVRKLFVRKLFSLLCFCAPLAGIAETMNDRVLVSSIVRGVYYYVLYN